MDETMAIKMEKFFAQVKDDRPIDIKILDYVKKHGYITTADQIAVGTVDLRKALSDMRKNPRYEITDAWEYKYNKEGKVIKKWKRYYVKEVV